MENGLDEMNMGSPNGYPSNQMQSKFAALIPSILSGKNDGNASKSDADYFWHSFFLLKPEFIVIQNSLTNYSIEDLRTLVSKCIEAIGSSDTSQIAMLRRINASYLLTQLFETLWPRVRSGNFGVDTISILCGLEKADMFFDNLFKSILSSQQPEPVLVLISLLTATRDIETNALTDFFTLKCKEISSYCLTASDLHLLLFSLLLQLDRPEGPFILEFKNQDATIFNSLITNLLARCCQLYKRCHSQPTSNLFRSAPSLPPVAKIGLYNPSDYVMPSYFLLFEPFVDTAILCFYERVKDGADSSLLSSGLCLLSNIIIAATTPHAGDKLRMLILTLAFLFDHNPQAAALPFDYQQFKSCLNTGIVECHECTIGAMALDVITCLLEMPKTIDPIADMLGRILYTIINKLRGNHNVKWRLVFDRILKYVHIHMGDKTQFNGYAIAIFVFCSSYRAALFKRDDGFIHMLQALSAEPMIGMANYSPPEPFARSEEFIEKCHEKLVQLIDVIGADVATQTYAQVEAMLPNINIELDQKEFPPMEKLSEYPKFKQMFHIYSRTHCENSQALLHFAISHI